VRYRTRKVATPAVYITPTTVMTPGSTQAVDPLATYAPPSSSEYRTCTTWFTRLLLTESTGDTSL
jgi:hypothetical protein